MADDNRDDLAAKVRALEVAFHTVTGRRVEREDTPELIKAAAADVVWRLEQAKIMAEKARALEVAFYTLTGHQSADHTPEDIQSIAAQERAASSLTARKLSNVSAREDALARAFGMLTNTAPEALSPEDIEEVAKITNAERKEARRAATDIAWKQRETKARLNALAGAFTRITRFHSAGMTPDVITETAEGVVSEMEAEWAERRKLRDRVIRLEQFESRLRDAFEKVTGQKIEEIDSVLYVDGLVLGAYADRFSREIEKIEEILHHAAERMAERNARP